MSIRGPDFCTQARKFSVRLANHRHTISLEFGYMGTHVRLLVRHAKNIFFARAVLVGQQQTGSSKEPREEVDEIVP